MDQKEEEVRSSARSDEHFGDSAFNFDCLPFLSNFKVIYSIDRTTD